MNRNKEILPYHSVTPYQTLLSYNDLKDSIGKRENSGNQHFLVFSYFATFQKTSVYLYQIRNLSFCIKICFQIKKDLTLSLWVKKQYIDFTTLRSNKRLFETSFQGQASIQTH